MEKVRLGIIGYGNMGSAHAKHIWDGKCPEIVLTAVADIDQTRLDACRTEQEARRAGGADIPVAELFSTAEEMMAKRTRCWLPCRITITRNTFARRFATDCT